MINLKKISSIFIKYKYKKDEYGKVKKDIITVVTFFSSLITIDFYLSIGNGSEQ